MHLGPFLSSGNISQREQHDFSDGFVSSYLAVKRILLQSMVEYHSNLNISGPSRVCFMFFNTFYLDKKQAFQVQILPANFRTSGQ